MRFSGHETFAIREGWLYKGLSSLDQYPNFFEEPFPADQLGVGTNMAKSIRHWLVATGLAEYRDQVAKSRSKRITVSEFGKMVLKEDPYFNNFGTWCFIHLNLVNSQDATASWAWFFGSCADTVFDRNNGLEQFRRWSLNSTAKHPSATTLQKDLNCLLASYAQRPPTDNTDPEEAMDCPLWELGLLNYYRGSASFRTNRSPKKISAEAIGYALAVAAGQTEQGSGGREMTFEEAATIKGGPGRAFLMGPSALYDAVSRAMSENSKSGLKIGSLVGQRVLKYGNQSPLEWVDGYYKRIGRNHAK